MARVAVEVLGDSASLTAALGTATRGLVQFGSEAEVTAAKVDATFAGMSDSALRLAVAQDKLAISTARYGAGSTGAAAAASLYRKQVEGIAAGQLAAAETVGRRLTTAVALPTIAIGYEAVKMGSKFEDAMRLIQTQAGASGAELDSMTSSVLGMVKGGQSFGQTAGDMANGLFYIESSGVRGTGAINVLKVAAAGAAVGQTDMAQTANALTSAMHAYGVPADHAANVMATLNATIGAGKLHMEDLNAALGTKLLPTAKSFGISMPEITAAVATFTKSGPDAVASSTNLTQALIRMEAPTGAGRKALHDMGLSATVLGEQLRHGGLPEALGTLVQAYERVVSTQGKQVANQDIFNAFGGSKGGAAALLMVQQYANYMKTLDQVQTQSNPATFWAQVSRTMDLPSQKIKVDVAKIGGSMIELGVAIAPVVATAADGITKLVGAFQHLPGATRAGLGVIVGFAAVGGPVILGITAVTKAVRGVGLALELMGIKGAIGATAVEGELVGVGASATAASTKVGLLSSRLSGLGALGTVAVGIAVTETVFKPLEHGISNKIEGIFGGTASSIYDYAEGFATFGAIGKSPADLLFGGGKKKPTADAIAKAGGLTGPAGVAGLPASLAGLAGPTAAMTAAAALSGPTTLTAAQKLALELAQHPNDITFLNQKAAADQHTTDWLNKRRAEGKISADNYVKQISALYNDQQSVQGTIAGIQTQAAATAKAAADAAKALREAFTVPDALQIGQARAGTTAGLGDDVAMAREMKAFALHALASHKLGTQGTIEALNALSQANSVIGAFNIPVALQIAQAKASTTKTTADDIRNAKEMKAFAEHALASKKLSAEGQIAAWNTISSANSVIGTADATVGASQKVSLAKLTAGLGLSGAARKEEEARIAQALTFGGKLPGAATAQGIPVGKGVVHIHGDIVLPGVRDPHGFADELESLGKHSAPQTRGINAGRFRGHP